MRSTLTKGNTAMVMGPTGHGTAWPAVLILPPTFTALQASGLRCMPSPLAFANFQWDLTCLRFSAAAIGFRFYLTVCILQIAHFLPVVV